MHVLQPGDVLRIDAWDDASIAGTYPLDAEGGIDLAVCGRVELRGVAEADASDMVRRCLVAANVYEDAIHVIARVVHRGAAITVRTDAVACSVAYEPGITLTQGIVAALGFGQGRIARVMLRRAGVERTIDVDAITSGGASDEQLAPGDEIVLVGRRSVMCKAKMDAAPPTEVPDPNAPPVPEGSTCGELMLEEAELAAAGKRAAHPEVIATVRAREFRCGQDPGLESLPAACGDAKQRQLELSASHGPAHPTMIGLAAALAVCDEKLTQHGS